MRHAKKIGAGFIAGAIGIATPVINHFEGHRNQAYPDIIGVWTACAGITEGVNPGDIYTDEQCDQKLATELKNRAAFINSQLSDKAPMTEKRFAAFLSLDYNIGNSAFARSTVLRKINRGDVQGACDAMLMWNKAGGKVVAGLNRRRHEERKLCLANP